MTHQKQTSGAGGLFICIHILIQLANLSVSEICGIDAYGT